MLSVSQPIDRLIVKHGLSCDCINIKVVLKLIQSTAIHLGAANWFEASLKKGNCAKDLQMWLIVGDLIIMRLLEAGNQSGSFRLVLKIVYNRSINGLGAVKLRHNAGSRTITVRANVDYGWAQNEHHWWIAKHPKLVTGSTELYHEDHWTTTWLG